LGLSLAQWQQVPLSQVRALREAQVAGMVPEVRAWLQAARQQPQAAR